MNKTKSKYLFRLKKRERYIKNCHGVWGGMRGLFLFFFWRFLVNVYVFSLSVDANKVSAPCS